MKCAALVLLLLCGCTSGGDTSAASGEVESHVAQPLVLTGELATADSLIVAGHPWRATQLVAPLLRVASTRTPSALLVAARAAAGWNGWAEVESLLAREPWIDSLNDGAARELLARSALQRGDDTVALTRAAAALRTAIGNARPVRQVLYARALERNNLFDSAAVLYARAGESLRPIRDWLELRVAGNLADSAKRAAALSHVTLRAARPRVAWTEAQARERFSDAVGAAQRYAALGAMPAAFRLRLSVAPDVASRDTIRRELVTFVGTHSGTADAKSAVDVLDRAFPTLTPPEEIVIARSAAVSGPVARAVTAFARALTQPALVTPNDLLLYGQALSRAGRSRDALAQLAAVTGPLASQAAYQRARVLLTSGTGDATRAALRDIITRFPTDNSAASSALYLLADLSVDDGDDAGARTLYERLARAYPTSARAASSRFNAGIIAFAAGDLPASARAFDSLSTQLPRSDESVAARYWAGRAWAATGDSALARARWRGIVSSQPQSYYAVVSAARLHEPGWAPPAAPDTFARFASIDSAMARIALLDQLGMDTETRFEYDALEAAAAGNAERLASTAHALLVHDQSTRAIRLAQKLIDAGQRDARAYRLLYPIVDRDALTSDARARALDPALVAGLIRQESAFNPRAVSLANARGLMQVLPAVGEDVARALAFPLWSPALLTDADANLQLGTAHLASYVKQYGPLPRVLAAYNAGGSRVDRWTSRPGADDPELFTERIPFVETRDYVRIVQRNAELYRVLYRRE